MTLLHALFTAAVMAGTTQADLADVTGLANLASPSLEVTCEEQAAKKCLDDGQAARETNNTLDAEARPDDRKPVPDRTD